MKLPTQCLSVVVLTLALLTGCREAERLPPGAELAEIAHYETDFRQHYEKNYAGTGYGYDQYRPAYHYGFDLAKDLRYSEMDWNTLELQAHRNWNEATMGPWDRYKEAVRYGWERGSSGNANTR
jgi:hypothetical protein